jgi:hypothetical protein
VTTAASGHERPPARAARPTSRGGELPPPAPRSLSGAALRRPRGEFGSARGVPARLRHRRRTAPASKRQCLAAPPSRPALRARQRRWADTSSAAPNPSPASRSPAGPGPRRGRATLALRVGHPFDTARWVLLPPPLARLPRGGGGRFSTMASTGDPSGPPRASRGDPRPCRRGGPRQAGRGRGRPGACYRA